MASIRCAHCKDRHESVALVSECAEWEAYAQWEAEAEAAAERAAERYWEEGTAAQAAQYAWEVEQDEMRAAAYGF